MEERWCNATVRPSPKRADTADEGRVLVPQRRTLRGLAPRRRRRRRELSAVSEAEGEEGVADPHAVVVEKRRCTDLEFRRIVVSETEALNMLANLV